MTPPIGIGGASKETLFRRRILVDHRSVALGRLLSRPTDPERASRAHQRLVRVGTGLVVPELRGLGQHSEARKRVRRGEQLRPRALKRVVVPRLRVRHHQHVPGALHFLRVARKRFHSHQPKVSLGCLLLKRLHGLLFPRQSRQNLT